MTGNFTLIFHFLQVMPAGLYPSVPPKDGIFITGLRLYNALWDVARGMLMSGASDKQSFQDMPVIWLKPYDISSPSRVPVKHQQYLSPLYCSADHRCHSHAAMVTALPLPTLIDPTVWHQNRVFLATTVWTQLGEFFCSYKTFHYTILNALKDGFIPMNAICGLVANIHVPGLI